MLSTKYCQYQCGIVSFKPNNILNCYDNCVKFSNENIEMKKDFYLQPSTQCNRLWTTHRKSHKGYGY